MLRMRKPFNLESQRKLQHTLARHLEMTTPELEERAHELWMEAQAKKAKCSKLNGPRMTCAACDACDWKL